LDRTILQAAITEPQARAVGQIPPIPVAEALLLFQIGDAAINELSHGNTHILFTV
jgi:hypothetical protein